MISLVDEAYKIADKNNVILKGNIKLSNDKKFLKVSRDVFKVNRIANKTMREIKKIIKDKGYKKVWSKGVFSFYGDLRPLAVKAGFGSWAENGIIENEKYGTNFLIAAVFYK